MKAEGVARREGRRRRVRWFVLVAIGSLAACSATEDGRGDRDPAASAPAQEARGAERPSPPAGMRLVPGGDFWMGTDPSVVPDLVPRTGAPAAVFEREQPRHRRSVRPFHLDTVDVTNQAFAEFVAANPGWTRQNADQEHQNGRYLEHWDAGGPPDSLLTHPVTFVTWFAALAYCQWRGARLPTEAEWEYAAGAGLDDRTYPWGDAPPADSLVSWSGDGVDHTLPVASFPPNPYGLYDMAGNVWKFLVDVWWETHDRERTPDRSRRAVRGGSWGANAANLRVRYRDSHRPWEAREMVGFRCAKDADPGADR